MYAVIPCVPTREPSAAHGACHSSAWEPCLPRPALPVAGMMPVEAGMGSHGATWALGQGLHGDFWAKPCFWSCPRNFSTSVRWSLVIVLWFSRALQGSGLAAGLLGESAPWTTARPALGWHRAAWEPTLCWPGQGCCSASLLLSPPTPGRSPW